VNEIVAFGKASSSFEKKRGAIGGFLKKIMKKENYPEVFSA